MSQHCLQCANIPLYHIKRTLCVLLKLASNIGINQPNGVTTWLYVKGLLKRQVPLIRGKHIEQIEWKNQWKPKRLWIYLALTTTSSTLFLYFILFFYQVMLVIQATLLLFLNFLQCSELIKKPKISKVLWHCFCLILYHFNTAIIIISYNEKSIKIQL